MTEQKKIKGFITDAGAPSFLEVESGKIVIPRYAVWMWNEEKGKYLVVDCSDDLEALKKQYGVDVAHAQTPHKE